MYKKIIIAIDGSDLSDKVLEHGCALGRFSGAKVKIVTVTEPSVLFMPDASLITASTTELLQELELANAETARALLEKASKTAQVAGLSIETEHIRKQHPAEGILLAAESDQADLIVMGSHGRRGLGRLLLGSQASEVLSRAKVPVLVIR